MKIRYIYNEMDEEELEGAADMPYLSRRFQEIMDLAYRQGTVSATDLERSLTGNPSNSTVRTQLRVLVERGHLARFDENGQTLYKPTRPRQNAAVAAMQRFLSTFVNGSAEKALSTLLTAKEADLSDEDLARLQNLIDAARKEKSK